VLRSTLAPGAGAVAKQALPFAVPVALLLGLALVVLFLALGEPDFKLDATAFEVQVQRYQRVARALDLADQAIDFDLDA
jgi:NhaP-type Na+/H+ or K+/H+ antiporter